MAKLLDNKHFKFRTNMVRLSYANLDKPSETEINKGKYSVSVLIPKSDVETVDLIENLAATIIKEEKNGKFKGKNIQPGVYKFLKDGDIERPGDEAYKGHYFFNTKSEQKPNLFDKYGNPISQEGEIYSGCYALVIANLYAFNQAGNFGIASGLYGVKKVKEGEPLSGGSCTADDFGDETFEDDDDFFN